MDNDSNLKKEVDPVIRSKQYSLNKNQNSLNKNREKSISKRSNTNHPNKSNSNKIINNNSSNNNNNLANNNNISKKSNSNNISKSINSNNLNTNNLNKLKSNSNSNNYHNLNNFQSNLNKPSSSSKSNVNIISNISKKKEENVRIEFGDLNPKITENRKYNNNKIVSTKYNLITWAPKSLLIQFRRAANIYFLIVTILTCMNFSPKQPGSMIATFCLVLIATMLKEGIEDYYRYTQDRQSNNRLVSKLINGQWVEVLCWTLRPGDVVKIKKEEEFSADILIIKSTNDTGYCYIDTKNLDGETNLKEKCSLEDFKKIPEENIGKLIFHIEVEKPNENLTSWKGLIEYEDREGPFCSLANLVLKGSVLKNTKYIIGIVIYSGKDTKIMKNSKTPRIKMSKVLVTMNKLLYSVFAFEIGLCLTFAILSTNWANQYMQVYSYISPHGEPDINYNLYVVNVLINFLTFFVAYSHMIPISLYVALEIVKIIQGLLIKYDNEIYDFGIDKPAICRSTDLIEELGQVEFIFSDKTGTLTQNSMILKKVYINGKVYGSMQDEHPETPHSINGDMSIFRKLKNEAESPNLNGYGESSGNSNKNYANMGAERKSNSGSKNNNNFNNNNRIGVAYNSNAFGKNSNDIIDMNRMQKNDANDAKYYSVNNNAHSNNYSSNTNNEYNSNNKLLAIPDKQQNRDKDDNNNNNNNNNSNANSNQVNQLNLQSNKENEISKVSSDNINNNNQNINNPSTNNNKNLNFKLNQIPPAQTTFSDTEHDKKMILDFFHLLTLCHACFPEKNKEGKIIYQGASPDDIALVKGAQQIGFEYAEKEFSEMTIKNFVHNTEKKYDLKVEFPFDSDRKRMSVIVQDKGTKNFSLLSKGADTTMLSRMKLDSAELDEINRVIKVLSKEGLRVLVIGSKQLSTKEYNSWYKNYSEDRNNGKDLNKLYEKMECNLNFLGLTAIEDKLQDGVPDTIYTLLTCNIRVWVLTGDKQDTAEEIAKSCKLINENMSIIYLLNDPNGKSPKEKLRELILKYGLKQESGSHYSSTRKRSALMRNQDNDSDHYNINNNNANNNLDNKNIANSNKKSNYYTDKNENENAINKLNSKYKNVSSSKNNNNNPNKDNNSNINNNKSNNYKPNIINQNPSAESEDIKSGGSYENGEAEEDKLSEEIIDLEYITKKIRKKEGKDISLIIDGITLEEILQDKKLSYLFFKISIAAKSVVCCRVSPKQKSKVVQLVKKYGKWVTLSIGDGANDVPMIMEAHIGVGIQGKEGTQAVRSADFSIGQFRFLEKLLLIYGRTGYMKISKFICYYFYKNIILVFTDIFFAFSNGFSGQIYFADYLSTLYNALFTSWPCVLTFSFEKDIDLSIVKKFPILYVAGQKNYFFNLKVFWGYILYAIFHGFICFYVPNLGLINANDKSGITFNHWYKSTTSFSLVIQIVTLKLMVISDFWNGLNIFSTFASIVLYYVILIVFCFKPISVIFQNELAGLIFNLFSYPKFWLVILITPLLALVPDITLKQIFYSVYPTPTEYIKQYLNDPLFLSMVYNDENQTLILNSQQAKDAEKRLQEILKRARAQKIKKKLVDKNSLENSELPLRDGSAYNNLISNDRSRRALLDNPHQIKIRKRKSRYAKQNLNNNGNKVFKNNYNSNDLIGVDGKHSEDRSKIDDELDAQNKNLNYEKNLLNKHKEFNDHMGLSDVKTDKDKEFTEGDNAMSFERKDRSKRNSNFVNAGNANEEPSVKNNNIVYGNDTVNEKTEEHNYMGSDSDFNQNENEEEEEEEYEYEENEGLSGEEYEEDYSQSGHSKDNASAEDNGENPNENEDSKQNDSDTDRNNDNNDNNNSNNNYDDNDKKIENSNLRSFDSKSRSTYKNNRPNNNIIISPRSSDNRKNPKIDNSVHSSSHDGTGKANIKNSNTPRESKNSDHNKNNNKNNSDNTEKLNKALSKEEKETEEIKMVIKTQTTAILNKLKNNYERKKTNKPQKRPADEDDEMSFNSSECSDSSDRESGMDEIKEERFENENYESSKNKTLNKINQSNNSNYLSRSGNKEYSSSKNEAPLFHEESKNEIFEIKEVKIERSHTRKSTNNHGNQVNPGFVNVQGDFINISQKENNFENLLLVKNENKDRSLNSSKNNGSDYSKQRIDHDEFLSQDAKIKKLKHK